jgi:hypothetical protein
MKICLDANFEKLIFNILSVSTVNLVTMPHLYMWKVEDILSFGQVGEKN